MPKGLIGDEDMEKRAIVLSVINYKGGVAKTTSAFNIASGINYFTDKKVLIIDLDPQCSLTNVCLKAYQRKINKTFRFKGDLQFNQTINYVIREYLQTHKLNIPAKIDLEKLVFKQFYRGYKDINYEFDFIAATMFDNTDKTYLKGLDDLEIEMAMNHIGKETRLNNLSLFPRFFTDTDLTNKYDFIIFDCPPANNLITQNALIVSDHYIIPTIMDDMSTNGISHLDSLIQNSILKSIQQEFGDLFQQRQNEVPYFSFFTKNNAQLLAIFETIRTAKVNNDLERDSIIQAFPHKLLEAVIINHKDTARATSTGYSVFSLDIIKAKENSPHKTYGNLTIEILKKLKYPFSEVDAKKKIMNWY
jgi:chromosome partitioning protein